MLRRSAVRVTVHLVLQARSGNIENFDQVNHDLQEQDFLENDHLANQQNNDQILFDRVARKIQANFNHGQRDHHRQSHNKKDVQVLKNPLHPVEEQIEEHVQHRHQAKILGLVVLHFEVENFDVENEKGVKNEKQHQQNRGQVLPEERLESDADFDVV